MLDESMFEDIHEIAENSAYLKAVEQKDVSLDMLHDLPPYEQCRDIEERLRSENKLTFDAIFNEPTGFYQIKCFLIADYAVDKAIFIKDVEAYKSMRFESARRKVAALLYQRFVSTEEGMPDFKHGLSVFQLIQQSKGTDEKKERDGKVQPASINLSGSPSNAALSLELKTITPPSAAIAAASSTLQLNNGSSTNGHAFGAAGSAQQHHHGGLQPNGHPSPAHGLHHAPVTPSSPSHAASTFMQMGHNNNSIGVYGKSVRVVREKVSRGEAPKDLFDEVARDVMTDLKLDVFPRFKQGEFYRRYIRTKWIETQRVLVKDFTTFRVLGRGGFGAVHACRKKNSGQIYAMKCFPSDIRVLTNRGFMFLDELELAMVAGVVLFAAYDVATHGLQYVPGKLVLPPGDQHVLVNITAAGEEHRWAEGSDPYGRSWRNTDNDCTSHLSLRVTADHELYVQLGNTTSAGDGTIVWASRDGLALPPTKLDAHELLETCCCTDAACAHFRTHARFISAAAAGVQREDSDSRVDELLSDALGLTSPEQVDAFLELYGFWLANGDVQHESDERDVLPFSQLRTEELAWVRLKLSACGLHENADWSIADVHSNGTRTVHVCDSSWLELFDADCGKSAKRFFSWVSTLVGLRRLRLIVRGLRGAQGSCVGASNVIRTSSMRFRDELMVVLMHAGYSAFFELQHEPGALVGYGLIGARGGRVYSAEEVKDAPQLYRTVQATSECWRVHWTAPDTLQDDTLAYRPVVRCHDGVRSELYRGRVWCVSVQHDDHLVVAQRAWRNELGMVTKAARPVVVGQCINKKLVKVKSALDNVLEERNVLTMMKSHFVTNLKYGLQDEDTLYLIMDLMLGGDLKFHLINAGRFTEKRARFYAAQVLLGLEHVHKLSIIYRDMKLENVLLDHQGNCRLSDLGLAVVTKVKIKGYAGTPGYTAPEMIKNKLYGPAADIFSYGVMLYRMLCGSKPFKGKADRDLDKAVIERKPTFPKEIFSKEAISLLTGLLQKRPENRLGCGERGIDEVKEHAFFESIDWGLLEAGYIDPPFVPNKFDVNAASLKDIGDFDRAKYKHVKLDERFKQRIKNFEYINVRALQDEMVQVLEKADEDINFEKFAQQPAQQQQPQPQNGPACCILL